MNPERKEKEKQVLHLPYVTTNQKFRSDSYKSVKIVWSTCLRECMNLLVQ